MDLTYATRSCQYHLNHCFTVGAGPYGSTHPSNSSSAASKSLRERFSPVAVVFVGFRSRTFGSFVLARGVGPERAGLEVESLLGRRRPRILDMIDKFCIHGALSVEVNLGWLTGEQKGE